MIIWLLFSLSQKILVPAHLDMGFKALPYITYINTLDGKKPAYPDTCCIVLDTVIQKTVKIKKTVIYEIKSLVFTYESDSIKPIEKVREIEADSFIVVVSTDPTGPEKHNKELANKRAEYLGQFLRGKVNITTKPNMGRFAIVKIFKRR